MVGSSRLISVLRILIATIAYRQWVRSLPAISETASVSICGLAPVKGIIA